MSMQAGRGRWVVLAVLGALMAVGGWSRTASAQSQDDARKEQQQDENHRGRKYTPPPPTAKIKVTVLRSTTGKPIPNAAVIFHPMKGDKDEGALELKSNEDGIVNIDVIPVGDTVRLQVISNGWQTFGDDYPIDTSNKEIVVKMKRPTAQYSIYKSDGSGAQNSNVTPQGQSTSAKPSSQTPVPQ